LIPVRYSAAQSGLNAHGVVELMARVVVSRQGIGGHAHAHPSKKKAGEGGGSGSNSGTDLALEALNVLNEVLIGDNQAPLQAL